MLATKKLLVTGALLLGVTLFGTVGEKEVLAKTTDKIVSNYKTATDKQEKIKGTIYKVVTQTETIKYSSGKKVATTTVTTTPVKNSTPVVSKPKPKPSISYPVYNFNNKYLGDGQLPNYSKYNVSKTVQDSINNQLKGFWKEAGANLKDDFDQSNKKYSTKEVFNMAGKSEITYRQNNTISLMSTILSKDTKGKSIETFTAFTYNTNTGNQLKLTHMFKNAKEFNNYNKVYKAHMKKNYSATMDLNFVAWYFNKNGQLIVRATPNDSSVIKKYLDIVVPNQYLLVF